MISRNSSFFSNSENRNDMKNVRNVEKQIDIEKFIIIENQNNMKKIENVETQHDVKNVETIQKFIDQFLSKKTKQTIVDETNRKLFERN